MSPSVNTVTRNVIIHYISLTNSLKTMEWHYINNWRTQLVIFPKHFIQGSVYRGLLQWQKLKVKLTDLHVEISSATYFQRQQVGVSVVLHVLKYTFPLKNGKNKYLYTMFKILFQIRIKLWRGTHRSVRFWLMPSLPKSCCYPWAQGSDGWWSSQSP